MTVEQPLNVRNTVIKFLLDQTFGAVGNNAGFLLGITAIRGGSWDDCMNALNTVSAVDSPAGLLDMLMNN